jgi:hypothetical protein
MRKQDKIRQWKKYRRRLGKWIKKVDKYILKLEREYAR